MSKWENMVLSLRRVRGEALGVCCYLLILMAITLITARDNYGNDGVGHDNGYDFFLAIFVNAKNRRGGKRRITHRAEKYHTILPSSRAIHFVFMTILWHFILRHFR